MRVGFNFPIKAKVSLGVNWPLFQAHIYFHITALFNPAHICLNMCPCEIWAGSMVNSIKTIAVDTMEAEKNCLKDAIWYTYSNCLTCAVWYNYSLCLKCGDWYIYSNCLEDAVWYSYSNCVVGAILIKLFRYLEDSDSYKYLNRLEDAVWCNYSNCVENAFDITIQIVSKIQIDVTIQIVWKMQIDITIEIGVNFRPISRFHTRKTSKTHSIKLLGNL